MLLLLLPLVASAGPGRAVQVCPVDADGQPVVAARVTLGDAEEPGTAFTGCRTLDGSHARGQTLELLVTAPGRAPVSLEHRVRRRNRVVVTLTALVPQPPASDGELVQIRHGYGKAPPACPPGTEGPEAPADCSCMRTRQTRYLFGSCWE